MSARIVGSLDRFEDDLSHPALAGPAQPRRDDAMLALLGLVDEDEPGGLIGLWV